EGSVRADVLLVWRHDFFAQDIILRSAPHLPPGLNPATTRLEVATEFIDSPQPRLSVRKAAGETGTSAVDHAVLRFGSMNIITGSAFPVKQRAGLNFEVLDSGQSPECATT